LRSRRLNHPMLLCHTVSLLRRKARDRSEIC
jgi:hypothetical protein